ncbi:MAG: hypothetical protein J6Q68_00590 [Clostridia bacterium]|nr:hypothetical protein [Clostridia bacterium]
MTDMITVREVSGKRDQKAFIEFPLKLYKDCPYFVPPLYSMEKKLFSQEESNRKYESVFFLAEKDGKTVGRIQGHISKDSKSGGEIRFTRFDSVDDVNVSRALFGALEDWARTKNKTTISGPLGYRGLDRVGVLVEGFDENATFTEWYNYEYYAKLMEDFGFKKDYDWLEFELKAPKNKNELLEKMERRTLELNKLHVADSSLPRRKYIKKYSEAFFDCLKACGALQHLTPAEQRELVISFYPLIKPKFAVLICDENEKIVAFGLSFPSIGPALKKSHGRLTLPAIKKISKILRKPRIMDLGLIAVRPEYQNMGVNAVLVNRTIRLLNEKTVESCETNLNLETNDSLIAQWKFMAARQHKRRRAYTKTIETENIQNV